MKPYALFTVLSVCIIVVAMAFVKKETDYPDKHLEIVLRNIGHQVLLHSRDSSSRVLPVEAINANTFRISFENSIEFTPDTLMMLVHQQLANTAWPQAYTVSVNNCIDNKTIFAYEVNKAHGDLKPCRGRLQRKGCYTIDIAFPGKKSFNYSWLLLALIPAAFAGWYYARRRTNFTPSKERKEETVEASPSNKDAIVEPVGDYKKIGRFNFSESKGMLQYNGETIELSDKETKALGLLTVNINQVVARDLLMKEIWEQDGVVVINRNVDVLISKLRKKLSGDPDIKIVNVPGKGYKLTVTLIRHE